MPVIGRKKAFNGVYLAWAATKLNDTGNWFGATSGNIRYVFLLGEYLFDLFRTLGYFFKDASGYLYSADDFISYYLSYVYDIIEGYGFLDLLNWASSQFSMIRVNPLGWIYLQLGKIGPYAILALSNPLGLLRILVVQVFWTFDWLYNNPVGLIDYLLRYLRSWLGSFLDNPHSHVVSLLAVYMPDIYSFLVNPLEYTKTMLRGIIFQFDLLLINPVAWLIVLLNQVNPHMAAFVANPENYLKYQISTYFGMPPSFFDNPHWYLFDKMLFILDYYFDTFVVKLKDLIVKFIMRYI